MELDKRIKIGKRPLTCLDVDQAQQFVGKECIFSDSFINYKNIQSCTENPQYIGILSIEDKFKYSCKEEYPYKNGTDGYCYALVLPLEWIKESGITNFVPYTLDTWKHEFEPGEVITFRGKKGSPKDNISYECIYNGYLKTKEGEIIIILGPFMFSFNELFELHEINRDNTWEPFGRKVETINLGH